jgi:hypothetical protein
MEYRGIDYSVVRTSSRDGWCWSVKCEDSQKMGTHASREGAMLHAERFIDEVIKHRKRIARLQSQF